MNLSFISAYHPQMDRKTKVVNQILGDVLRSLVVECHSRWDQILPQAKFSYKDSPNRSKGQSPFHIMYGIQLRGVYELRDLEQSEFRSDRVEEFAANMQELHSKIKEWLQNSNQEYKRRADQYRR
jgi:hypothetical protein